ncbi:MAG TPA: Rsd/AlgQ family anti-sigma factor [Crenotrichaceae bacterium]|nr:Rsd/AlgQ family anti-sigma factor [Crenotrichaceae bacterium]
MGSKAMGTHSEDYSKRRTKTMSMIEGLLKERQHMWSLYCQFALKDETSEELSSEPEVRSFCQVLIEYLSIGHFGIYQRIAEGNERRESVLKVAQEVYPKLIELTNHAVAFNDKYANLRNEAMKKELSTDLSALGETLATRIELEDQLIESLMK